MDRLRQIAQGRPSFRTRETKFSSVPNSLRLSNAGHVYLREPVLNEMVAQCGFGGCKVQLKDPECALELWARCEPTETSGESD